MPNSSRSWYFLWLVIAIDICFGAFVGVAREPELDSTINRPPPKMSAAHFLGGGPGHIGVVDLRVIVGSPRLFGETTVSQFRLARFADAPGIEGYSIQFPEMAVGDICPLAGRAYQVTKIHPLDGICNCIEMELLEAAVFHKAPAREHLSWTVPIGFRRETGGGFFHGCNLKVVKLLPNDDDAKRPPGAILETRRMRPTEEKETQVEVHEGDFVKLGDFRHQVKSIVPANSTTGIVGWIELDQKPMK